MKYLVTLSAFVAATPVMAGVATPVPELTAGGAVAALVGVAAVVALIRERRK